MPLRIVQVNIKARDEIALGTFWAEALGWETSSEAPGVTNLVPPGFDWPGPEAVCIDLVRVPDPETVHYRTTLDLATTSADHRRELVARLERSAPPGSVPAPTTTRRSSCSIPKATRSGCWCPSSPTRASGRSPRSRSAATTRGSSPGSGPPPPTGWCSTPATTAPACARTTGSARTSTSSAVPSCPAASTSTPCRTAGTTMPYRGDDQAAEVERLRALGATGADVGQGEVSWVVMADPAGNQFCVLTPGG